MDDLGQRLARRIRMERESRGWSPAEFAKQARVSRAMVAKIEAGQSSPTAALLGKLSGALELTMSTLLARAETEGRSGLVRRAEQPVWLEPSSKYVRRQIFPVPGSRTPVDLTEVELPAGARVDYPASSYAFNRHLIWLLEGELVFLEGADAHYLSPGDCLELGPPQACRFENRTGSVCRYVVSVLRSAT